MGKCFYGVKKGTSRTQKYSVNMLLKARPELPDARPVFTKTVFRLHDMMTVEPR